MQNPSVLNLNKFNIIFILLLLTPGTVLYARLVEKLHTNNNQAAIEQGVRLFALADKNKKLYPVTLLSSTILKSYPEKIWVNRLFDNKETTVELVKLIPIHADWIETVHAEIYSNGKWQPLEELVYLSGQFYRLDKIQRPAWVPVLFSQVRFYQKTVEKIPLKSLKETQPENTRQTEKPKNSSHKLPLPNHEHKKL